MMGQKDDRLQGIGQRLRDFIVYAIGHRRILRELYPGLMHLFIFCACAIPLLIIIAVQIKFSIPALFGNLFSLFLDGVGSFGLLGIGLAAYRRYIQKPDRLSDTRAEDAIALIWVFAIIFLGLLCRGTAPEHYRRNRRMGSGRVCVFLAIFLCRSRDAGLHP